MTTPAQMAVGTRILKAVARDTIKSVVVSTKDGLDVEITVIQTCAGPTPESLQLRFNVFAGVTVNQKNRDSGCTAALEAHGFWVKLGRSCGCDDSDCEEVGPPQYRKQKHIIETVIAATCKYPAMKLYEMIRDVTELSLCSCKTFFITDGGDVCFDCAVKTAANAEARADRGMCGICHESVTTDDATACCKQPMHAACLDRSMEATATCPLCRQPGAKRARVE
jgi:hypothetical protein